MEELVRILTTILAGAIGAFFSYVFFEKRGKRLIETYWKIEEEYRSDIQHEARQLIEEVEKEFEGFKEEREKIDFYNQEYHLTPDRSKKKTANGIRYRIRFLSKIGLLLRKKMVDKDLVFDLIGTGLELDKQTMKTVLQAHREGDNKPDMYQHFEYLYQTYEKWKEKKRFK